MVAIGHRETAAMQLFELLPPEIPNYGLPAGMRMPENIVLNEDEAARFLREPVDRLRKRRLNGTGPVFVRREDEAWGAKYLVWDLLAWLVQSRRTEMPPNSRRSRRKAADQSSDAACAA
ncbi:hypothetical protein SAMN05216360_12536 [Methylobacterium phyllostachyos]|uniref:Uncharacterized protein n=1 Tax=Methylobacterium phyllostachyos TaxID=582672 RepID=A0A1H0K8I6_9HYPH|nr:hypothetical protein [Methylobacterium phyllostachyos]SDO52040.1 hypothetical protein SAMN05216360_12536 [Methylobacterium phyllostachyos]